MDKDLKTFGAGRTLAICAVCFLGACSLPILPIVVKVFFVYYQFLWVSLHGA